MDLENEELEEKRNVSQLALAITIVGALIFVSIVKWLWPDSIPFGLFELWATKGSFALWIRATWPIFAWAVIPTIFAVWLHRDAVTRGGEIERLARGLKVSMRAGLLEETLFRWLMFMSQIALYQLSNWIFFGWLGFGLVEWLYLHLEAPIVNFFTFGLMHSYLYTPKGWAVGAAMIFTTNKFREGHEYQGCLGSINSWYLGLFFFYLTFNFGLPVAIVAHAVYDALIFITQAIVCSACKNVADREAAEFA